MKSKTLKYPNSTRFQYAARLFHEKPLWERKKLLKRVQPKTLEEVPGRPFCCDTLDLARDDFYFREITIGTIP